MEDWIEQRCLSTQFFWHLSRIAAMSVNCTFGLKSSVEGLGKKFLCKSRALEYMLASSALSSLGVVLFGKNLFKFNLKALFLK